MTPQEKWKKDRKARWAFLGKKGGLRMASLLVESLIDSEFTSPETKAEAVRTRIRLGELTHAFNADLNRLKGNSDD